MLRVHRIDPVGFAANTYFVTSDGKNAVAIDPAQPRALEEAGRLGLNVQYVLLTHGHFDHTGGCAALQGAGAKVGIRRGEEALALGSDNLARSMGGYGAGEFPAYRIDFTFRGGEVLELCGMRFLVIATPGHTAGGACFAVEDMLFTGDTLFAGSVGRDDLPTGNGAQLNESLKLLWAREGDARVFPGHGDETTLDYERKYNGWMRW